ncbi:MAG TPA: hypothetical protein VGH03_15335 [Caulobacteraceae bacterium]|jgi:hypothetical protein
MPADTPDPPESAPSEPGAGRLLNPGHEAFARAQARGLTQLAAYEGAGYRPDGSRASALARRTEVKARIEWLARREKALATAAPEPTLLALLAIVEAGRRTSNGACAKETRLTLRAARDLRRTLGPPPQTAEPATPAAEDSDFRPLCAEEWKAKYGPGGWYWTQYPPK